MRLRSRLLGSFLGVWTVAGGCGQAGAQRQQGQPRAVLQALDTDGDGKLSAAEIAAAPKALTTLDRNGDGQITVDELQPRPENAGATADELVKQMMALDRNGDGVLTVDEVPARMQAMFARGDANHDGKLTPEEIRVMAARQGMPAGAAGAQNLGMMRMDPLLGALDADHDGVISTAEIAGASASLLKLDKNGDGEITADEMRMRQQTVEERVNHMLEEWDTNQDGRISKAEAPDRMRDQFETIDTNKDGFLDRAELGVYFSAMSAGGARAGSGQAGGGRPDGAPANRPN